MKMFPLAVLLPLIVFATSCNVVIIADCDEGELRCDGSILEECVYSEWAEVVDCDYYDSVCSDTVGGASCFYGDDINPDNKVPAAWTCDFSYYFDGECDCGCGVVDLGCADTTSASCQWDYCEYGSFPSSTNNAICVADGTEGWTCDTSYYFDTECDCGCGIVDTSCEDSTPASCQWDYCESGYVPAATNNAICVSEETGSWACDADFYGAGDGCDCGCGIVDADCADDSIDSCSYNHCEFGTPDSIDNSTCVDSGAPVEWTCDVSFYDNGDGCDCGCGVVDPDCLDSTAESCEWDYCESGTPDPEKNSICV